LGKTPVTGECLVYFCPGEQKLEISAAGQNPISLHAHASTSRYITTTLS